MKVIMAIGLPGSGKTDQLLRLRDHFHILSTSLMLRGHFSRGTAVGLRNMAHGKLIDDSEVFGLLKQRIRLAASSSDSKRGIIVDGYPRTIEQAYMLDESLTGQGMCVSDVMHFNVSATTSMARSIKRDRADSSPKTVEQRIYRDGAILGDIILRYPDAVRHINAERPKEETHRLVRRALSL